MPTNAHCAQLGHYSRCAYDHPSNERCGILTVESCTLCEKPTCEEALVEGRLRLPGGTLKYKLCEACAVEHMAALSRDTVVGLMNRVMKYAIDRPEISAIDYYGAADAIMRCTSQILEAA